ncbi:hypothetical protein RIF29_06101 [Crotalaria pallida]|uniref:Rad60/SUMO-like domain-containing protein n=1 Tax=Crotalaria pallida TaxID=3830 RepID=A0AAN9PA50_CROPI
MSGVAPKIQKHIRARDMESELRWKRRAVAANADFTSPHVFVRVNGTGLNEVLFKINRTTQLKKLMIAFCGRQSQSVDFNSIAFFYNSHRLQPEQTPLEVNMDFVNDIDAMLLLNDGDKFLSKI